MFPILFSSKFILFDKTRAFSKNYDPNDIVGILNTKKGLFLFHKMPNAHLTIY